MIKISTIITRPGQNSGIYIYIYIFVKFTVKMNLKNIGIIDSTHHRSSSGERRCARSCGKPLNEAAKMWGTRVDSG